MSSIFNFLYTVLEVFAIPFMFLLSMEVQLDVMYTPSIGPRPRTKSSAGEDSVIHPQGGGERIDNRPLFPVWSSSSIIQPPP